MPRPQFSLKTLLWLTVVVAAFCAGTQLHRYLEEHRADPRETSIRTALDEKTELDFTDEPLSDVVHYLKQRHEIEIQLDNKALTDVGVGSDTPVTRAIKGITLRSALKLMLTDLDLTYVVPQWGNDDYKQDRGTEQSAQPLPKCAHGCVLGLFPGIMRRCSDNTAK